MPAYLLGAPLVFVGLFALRNPLAAHQLFGVPYAMPKDGAQRDTTRGTGWSPFLYAKAIRDVALGLVCLRLQYQGNDSAVTTVLAASVVIGIGDGCIVWSEGGDSLRHKAWEHWIGTSVLLAPWVVMRMLT